MKKAAAVAFESVSRRFGNVLAVDAVTFRVEPGTLCTLLGPSGCGKTTTLRMIAGLELPSAGRILIGDRDVSRLSAAERDVTMVFQSYALFPHMNVIENVGYGLAVGNLSREEQRARAEEGLRKVGLAGYGTRKPSELSGGQQQRVAVARAMVLEPQVLLFDEPLSNLDAKLRRSMRADIRALQREHEITAVYVTHDQEEALAVSDKVVVMREGRIAQEGTPSDLYERPADRFVADFIGGANLLDAEIVAVDGLFATARVGAATVERVPQHGLKPGPATLAIRPTAMRLSPAVAGAAGLVARVLGVTYLGGHFEIVLGSDQGELLAIVEATTVPPATGAAVRIDFAPHGMALVPR